MGEQKEEIQELDNSSGVKRVRHSKSGIASFVIGVLCIGYYVLLWSTAEPISSMMDPGFAFLTAAIRLCPGSIFNLLGIILGIIGFRKGDRIFSLLGLLVNSFPVLVLLYTLLLAFTV